MSDIPIIDEQPNPTPQFDLTQILGLLSGVPPTPNSSPGFGAFSTTPNSSPGFGAFPPTPNSSPDLAGLLGMMSNNNQNTTNDLILKLLLNGGIQKLFTPKPKEPEPIKTINLDNYIRVD
ncbi:MAG: hypothetical protein LBQ05_00720 [Christensenellaceae bacterium]|jgi:hypothetical protein|nr:hypothetical protein [Christensenellaceae bacterium]